MCRWKWLWVLKQYKPFKCVCLMCWTMLLALNNFKTCSNSPIIRSVLLRPKLAYGSSKFECKICVTKATCFSIKTRSSSLVLCGVGVWCASYCHLCDQRWCFSFLFTIVQLKWKQFSFWFTDAYQHIIHWQLRWGFLHWLIKTTSILILFVFPAHD